MKSFLPASLFTHRELYSTNCQAPKKRRGLDQLARFIDFEQFRPRLDEITNYSKAAGHPHFDVVMMFKILILETFYNLSDEEMEYQLNDRVSFLRFCAIRACDKVPDARTIWLFRERLGITGCSILFEAFHKQMVSAGLEYSGGSIVDASFVEAPRQRNTREENQQIKESQKPLDSWSAGKKSHKDCEARWTKKGKETFFGYKHHAVVDMKTKIITNFTTTPANTHDSLAYEKLVGEETLILLGDSAYEGKAKAKELAQRGIKLICTRKRHGKNDRLSKEDKLYNRQVSSTRCRVEHIFGDMKHMGGDTVRSIGLARCQLRVALLSLVYNMRRFGYLCRIGELCPQI